VKKQSGEKNKRPQATNAPGAENLSRILKKYRATRMVIGHTPVSKNTISLSHPLYGNKVVMIDSRISKKKSGNLSCVEIHGNRITAHYAKRNIAGQKIADLEMKKLKKNGKNT
jgi:RNase H-fold protein (predicted Holliday junction resolvase)